MNDTALAVRRLTQAVTILAIRTTSVIGTNDATTVIHLCNEALAVLDKGDTERAWLNDWYHDEGMLTLPDCEHCQAAALDRGETE